MHETSMFIMSNLQKNCFSVDVDCSSQLVGSALDLFVFVPALAHVVHICLCVYNSNCIFMCTNQWKKNYLYVMLELYDFSVIFT
uniref:Uncharacterized protein n=1 Tax=Arundo donax TaxID=35708 RepID=A0A0A9EI88_ARUDO